MLMKREIKEREKGKKGDLGGRTEGGSMMEEGKFMVLASEKIMLIVLFKNIVALTF